MKFLSLFSGIEAASVAWHPLGWEAIAYAEIEPFPCAVLQHHYPNVPNLGDMTQVDWAQFAGVADLVVGGPPCQAFSVAGLRLSLDDDRGNLSLAFAKAIHAIAPRWAVIENVPGWLSTADNAFGCMLGGLVGADAPLPLPAQCGRWPDAGMVAGPLARAAWRILDAQHWGVPQRRRRVFIVVGRGDGADPAAVLFERDGLRGDPAPRREPGQDTTGTLGSRATGGGGLGTDFDLAGGVIAAYGGGNPGPIDIGTTLSATEGRYDFETETFLTHTLRGEGFDASEDGTGRGTPLLAVNLRGREGGAMPEVDPDGLASLRAADGGSSRSYLAFTSKDHGADAGDLSPTLRAMGHGASHANGGGQVAIAGPSPLYYSHDYNQDRVYDGTGISEAQTATRKPNFLLANHSTQWYNQAYASPLETHAGALLRALQGEVGEEAAAQWGLGVLVELHPPEVLRTALHGLGVRRPTDPQHGVVHHALSCTQVDPCGTVLSVWRCGCTGCPPPGWGSHEQLHRELGTYLSGLPYAPSSWRTHLLALREAAQGSRVLRQALSTLQEAWRPGQAGLADSDALPTMPGTEQREGALRETLHAGQASGHAVRRLVVEECEALQAFPRGYTRIPYRGKPADQCPDGPRYKALGNSMCCNVMAWIGERIQQVESLLSSPTT